MADAEAGWIFLVVIFVGLFVWGVALLVQDELQDRRFWREIKSRTARPNVRR